MMEWKISLVIAMVPVSCGSSPGLTCATRVAQLSCRCISQRNTKPTKNRARKKARRWYSQILTVSGVW